MNAVNAVQLLILGWTFTAVCQADDDISVICEDVTGTVGEVTLTCNVSEMCSGSCIKNYKLYYPEGYNDSEICKEKFPQSSCEQRNSFTCRFTPTTAMTGQFRFFVQTPCGQKQTKFTVNITETPSTTGEETRSSKGNDTESNPVIWSAVAFIIIIIIITMTIICKRKPNYQPQWIPVFLCRRHEDNSNCPEDMI